MCVCGGGGSTVYKWRGNIVEETTVIRGRMWSPSAPESSTMSRASAGGLLSPSRSYTCRQWSWRGSFQGPARSRRRTTLQCFTSRRILPLPSFRLERAPLSTVRPTVKGPPKDRLTDKTMDYPRSSPTWVALVPEIKCHAPTALRLPPSPPPYLESWQQSLSKGKERRGKIKISLSLSLTLGLVTSQPSTSYFMGRKQNFTIGGRGSFLTSPLLL